MKNKILVWILIIIIIVLSFLVLFKNSKKAVAPTGDEINQLISNENTENNLAENNVVNSPVQNETTNNVVSDCTSTTAPWIKVLSPNGGEMFTMGQSMTIKWKTCNPGLRKTVQLQIGKSIPASQNNGISGAFSNIVSFYPLNTLNDGAETVILGGSSTNGNWPFVAGDNFKIAINLTSLDEDPQTIGDSSDAGFTIKPASQPGKITEWGNDINGRHIGYIKSISVNPTLGSTSYGDYSLSIDYVQMNDCAGSSNCPNGYTLTNTNPLIRTFPVSNTAKVLAWLTPPGGGPTPTNTSIGSLKELVNNSSWWGNRSLFWITLNNGIVTEISQQYVP